MTDHHRATITALLIEQTLSLARVLVLAAEPVKAVRLLEAVAPQAAIDSEECRALAARIREQTDQAFSDAAYLRRYTEYTNGGTPEVPFSDHGVMGLFRAKAMLEVTRRAAASKPEFNYLSIGGGDGSIPRAVLQEHPGAQVWFSELLGVGGDVVKALQAEFPDRVKVAGRFDDPNNPLEFEFVDLFDVIECLEVAEHVTYLDAFLENIQDCLTPDGVACISVPNHLDWIEPLMLRNFENDDNWFHHVRALTPKSFGAALLGQGLKPTILHDGARGLFSVSRVGPRVRGAFTKPPVSDKPPSECAPGDVCVRRGRYIEATLVPGTNAVLEVFEGVLL